MSIDASHRLIDCFRIDEDKMPAVDAVFEVDATAFEAVSISMLFSESVMRIRQAHEVFLSGVAKPEAYTAHLDDVSDFFERYGRVGDHMAGLDACKRLASSRPLLTFGELCCIAVICRIGVGMMENAEDWAAHVGQWFSKVRKQVLDDYKVRCES